MIVKGNEVHGQWMASHVGIEAHEDCMASDGRMTYELERIWKGTVVVQLRYIPSIFLEGLRKTTNFSVGISAVPAEIRTEYSCRIRVWSVTFRAACSVMNT
jgi:hypothetical protein